MVTSMTSKTSRFFSAGGARRTLLAAALAVAALPLAAGAQRDRNRTRDRNDDGDLTKLDTTIAFGVNGTVDLSQVSGPITVTAWNRKEARINASTEAGSLRADLSQSRITLEVRSRRGRMGDSEFRLQVPVGTRVIARNVSGDISVTGTKAAAELRSVSGDVELSDGADQVTLESVSGSIKGRQVFGTMHLQSVSGDIAMSGLAGDIDASTVSGELTLLDAKSSNVRFETVSGDAEYRGTLDKSGRYEFKSHSGSVKLYMPEGSGVSFNVSTFSGSIESVIPMTLEPSDDGTRGRRTRTMEFSLGGGGARVTVRTFSGDITIERAGGRGKKEE